MNTNLQRIIERRKTIIQAQIEEKQDKDINIHVQTIQAPLQEAIKSVGKLFKTIGTEEGSEEFKVYIIEEVLQRIVGVNSGASQKEVDDFVAIFRKIHGGEKKST